jgi:hypothetical protein
MKRAEPVQPLDVKWIILYAEEEVDILLYQSSMWTLPLTRNHGNITQPTAAIHSMPVIVSPRSPVAMLAV